MLGEGNWIAEEDHAVSVKEALERIVVQADSLISGEEKSIFGP